jgi:hypothetical protein
MVLGSMFDYYAERGKRAQVAKSRQQEHKGKQRVVVAAGGEESCADEDEVGAFY